MAALAPALVATAPAGTSYVATCRPAAAGAAQGILTFKLDLTVFNIGSNFPSSDLSTPALAEFLNTMVPLDSFLQRPLSAVYGNAVQFTEIVSGVDGNGRIDVNVYFASLATAQDARAALTKVAAVMDYMGNGALPVIITAGATAVAATRVVEPVMFCGETFLGFYRGGAAGPGLYLPPGPQAKEPRRALRGCVLCRCSEREGASSFWAALAGGPFQHFHPKHCCASLGQLQHRERNRQLSL